MFTKQISTLNLLNDSLCAAVNGGIGTAQSTTGIAPVSSIAVGEPNPSAPGGCLSPIRGECHGSWGWHGGQILPKRKSDGIFYRMH